MADNDLQVRYEEIHNSILAGPNSELQEWIDTGVAWQLEGHVGRTAMAALRDGACVLGPKPVKDYYGNTIPAYYMVKEGTTGSVSNAEQAE